MSSLLWPETMQRFLLVLALCLATATAFAPSPLALRSSPTLKSTASARPSCKASGIVGAKMVATLPPIDDEEEAKPFPLVAWWQGLSPAKQTVYTIVAAKESLIIAFNWSWIISHIQGTAN